MHWYVCTDFEGHWPTGVAAVIQAHTEEQARQLLDEALRRRGLPGLASEDQVKQLDTTDQPQAYVLCDGDY